MGRNTHTNRKIWASEKVLENLQTAIICPIHNKGDKIGVPVVEGYLL